MTSFDRLLLRLRRSVLRCYELALYATLLAMAAAVAMVATTGSDDELQCGNSQNSPAVMDR